MHETIVKTPKRNIENTFENLISDEKQNNCANVGKKSKISAKSHEKVVKTSKETLTTRLKSYFCNVKRINCTNVGKEKIRKYLEC